MTVVVDSSVVVAALVDDGRDGSWARAGLPVRRWRRPPTCSSRSPRSVVAGRLSREVGASPHRDLIRIPVDLFPFGPVADRVWELHPSVTSDDAAFVALAEELDVPLWTLDRRLARASGPRCAFVVPPG